MLKPFDDNARELDALYFYIILLLYSLIYVMLFHHKIWRIPMTVSLYQREGSRKWWVRYHDSNGTLCRKSTGTSDEAAAQRIAERIEEELAIEGSDHAAEADDDRIARAESAIATNQPRAPLGEQIDNVEELMLSIVRHQAQGQEVAVKRIASLFRQLATRTRRLEQVTDRAGPGDERAR